MDDCFVQNRFFNYESMKKNRASVRYVAKEILNDYLKSDRSITQLKKLNEFKINCYENSNKGLKKWWSNNLSYNSVFNQIETNNTFDYKFYNAVELKCNWLDGDFDVAIGQHFVDKNGDTVKIRLNMPFGESFPIRPTIDREGIMFNSFQGAITKRILSLHSKLVNESDNFLTTEWLYDLISLISNSISLIDITLNQLYIKAEFDPLPGWVFNKDKLGERYNRRITDKLKWVYQITGNQLDDIEKELKSLITIKQIRNHTQHFDPPCFGYTLEDAELWLNLISDIGMLTHKIRKRLKSNTNISIYEIILLPKVLANGIVLFDRKRAIHNDTGYISTCWFD